MGSILSRCAQHPASHTHIDMEGHVVLLGICMFVCRGVCACVRVAVQQ